MPKQSLVYGFKHFFLLFKIGGKRRVNEGITMWEYNPHQGESSSSLLTETLKFIVVLNISREKLKLKSC